MRAWAWPLARRRRGQHCRPAGLAPELLAARLNRARLWNESRGDFWVVVREGLSTDICAPDGLDTKAFPFRAVVCHIVVAEAMGEEWRAVWQCGESPS